MYCKCSKIKKYIFWSQIKYWSAAIMVEINKILVKIANRDDPDQTAS